MLSLNEVKKRLLHINLKIVSDYKGVDHKHKILCYCGKVFECEIGNIFNGHTKSCGCYKFLSQKNIEKRLLKTGIKLLEQYKGVESKHKLKCHCGQEFVCLLQSILKGGTKSCGCIGNGSKGIFQSKHPSWRGHGKISLLYWNSIKRGASIRSLDFSLTIEKMWELFVKQKNRCAISGVEIDFATNSRLKDQTASLDRIDSSLGYEVSNVQWIHKDVNKMKNNMSDDSLIKWCRIICKNNKL